MKSTNKNKMIQQMNQYKYNWCSCCSRMRRYTSSSSQRHDDDDDEYNNYDNNDKNDHNRCGRHYHYGYQNYYSYVPSIRKLLTLRGCVLLLLVVVALLFPTVSCSDDNTTTTTIRGGTTTSNNNYTDDTNNNTNTNTTRKEPNYNLLNPYEQGCLYSHGIKSRLRICNSDDDDDEEEEEEIDSINNDMTTTTTAVSSSNKKKCRNNDMKYMEIRILGNNWESVVYIGWIIQIILSEILDIPTTIEPGRSTTMPSSSNDTTTTLNIPTLNFYNSNASFIYGTHKTYESIQTAYRVGDCTQIDDDRNIYNQHNYPNNQYHYLHNTTCAHIIPEAWTGPQSSSEIRKMVFDGIMEPPQTLGVLGLETWFITKFTLQHDPSLAVYLGLQGEENRHKLANTFLRPTTWYDYCTFVSTDNCTKPTNITQRPPQTIDEQLQYYKEGLYIGHFRYTDDNNCTLNPKSCTGHIADFPCDWDSFVQPQIKYLNIALKSNGPEQPIGGYPYPRLVELWKAANATKSNLIMHYWTPEPLYQEFVGTDAEFIRITMPPPSQKCEDSRRLEQDQCNLNDTIRFGSPDGICEQSSKNIYKIIVGNLYNILNDPKIPEPIRNPAHDALQLFQITELELGQIFDYKKLFYSNITNITMNHEKMNHKITSRDAVCRWVVENYDQIQGFIPRSYPRTKRFVRNNRFTSFTILLGCIAIVLVIIMSYAVYKHRGLRSIRLAQIEFLYLLLAGLLLVGIGSVIVGFQPSNVTCIVIIWFINFGYTLEFVPLIVKVAAVNKLVGSARRFRRVVLARKSLFRAVFAISAMVFLFLLVWSIVDPPTKRELYTLTSDVTDDGYIIVDVTHYCSSESGIWDYTAVGWNTLLLLCATVLAFQTRTLQKDFNESQTLAFLIYSHFVFVILRLITVILQFGTTNKTEKLVGFRSFIFSVDTIATILIYFVPKFSSAANKRDSDRFSSTTMNIQLDSSSRNINDTSGGDSIPEFSSNQPHQVNRRNQIIVQSLHNSSTSIATMHRSNRSSEPRGRNNVTVSSNVDSLCESDAALTSISFECNDDNDGKVSSNVEDKLNDIDIGDNDDVDESNANDNDICDDNDKVEQIPTCNNSNSNNKKVSINPLVVIDETTNCTTLSDDPLLGSLQNGTG